MGRRKGEPSGQRKGLSEVNALQTAADPAGLANVISFLEAIEPAPEEVRKTDAAWIRQRFGYFLEQCRKYGIKPNNRSFFVSVGMTYTGVRDAIYYDKTNPERSRELKRCLEKLASLREMMMASGEIPTIAGIFWQKNYDGLSDQQQIVIQDRSALTQGMSIQQLSDKYRDEVAALDIIVDSPAQS